MNTETELLAEPSAAPEATQHTQAQDDAPKESVSSEDKKPEKTPEQIEIAKLQNALARKRQQLADVRARASLASPANQEYNRSDATDSERRSYTPAELDELIEDRAKRLAPTLIEKVQAERQLHTSARALVKELGEDRFSELTNELAEVFPGDMQVHVLETKAPRALLEYLTDPENEVEATAIGKMSPYRAGAAIDALVAKLTAPQEKPQRSSAPAPIEATRPSGGPVEKDPSTMTYKQFVAWRQKQIAERRP